MNNYWHALKEHLRDPRDLIWISVFVIATYYLVTALLIHANMHKKTRGAWRLLRKNGLVDVATSIFWVLTPVVLIVNMLNLAKLGRLSLDLLLIYYGLFLFLFAFLYCMAEWHWPGSLIGIAEGEDGQGVPKRFEFKGGWPDEFMYFMISLQTQTALGYNRARPNDWKTDLIAGVQAIAMLFFVAVAIAEAVNLGGTGAIR